jgi:predicted transcriptional regulator
MIKVTFTLDDETVTRLRRVARRLGRPQSQVVREAVKEYEARAGKLSEEERRRLLDTLDRVMAQAPTRPAAEVDRELGTIRQARRRWRRRQTAPGRG